MRRTDGLYDISRRDLCTMVGLGGLAIACGCTDGGTSAIQTGDLGSYQPPDGALPHPIDAGPLPHDGSVSPGDGSTAAMCTGSPTDVGAPSSFVAGTPKYFMTGNFFVVRDAGGLYALTAKCTHQGATCVVQGSQFYCPRHGATFAFSGAATGAPAFTALVHYSMCLMGNGHVGVTTATQVAQAMRLDV